MCSIWCHKNHLQRGCHAFRAKNFFFIYRCLLCHLTSTPDPIELLSRFQRRMPHQATTNLAQIFEVRTLRYNPENQVSRLKASKSMEYTVKLYTTIILFSNIIVNKLYQLITDSTFDLHVLQWHDWRWDQAIKGMKSYQVPSDFQVRNCCYRMLGMRKRPPTHRVQFLSENVAMVRYWDSLVDQCHQEWLSL